MKTRIRATAVLGLPAVVTCCLLLNPTVAAASAALPLPASNYTVRHVCAAPAPGYASCLALELVPRTAAARAHDQPQGVTRGAPLDTPASAEGVFVLGPEALHSVYQLPTTSPGAQTIAIVDAYNDLNAEADLEVYDKEFGLPELPECSADEVSGCFEQVNQNGATGNPPFPASGAERAAEEVICETAIGETKEAACKEVEEADGWTTEISLDIEVSHAVCQNCKIVLVEADSASFFDLETAEDTAAGLPATEISNSWGGAECAKVGRRTECGEDSAAFNHQGIVITVAAGDDGYLDWDAPTEGAEKGFADYPASSPHVVAVGGTRLLALGPGGTWRGETVWNGDGAGGSGCSISFAAPAWQSAESDWSSVGCGSGRAVADISADADPYTGVAIYDSTPESPESPETGWRPIGGTSLASPLIASSFALAGGADGVAYPAKTLYEKELALPSSLHDVTEGSNGECSTAFNTHTGLSGCTELQEATDCSQQAICLAREGYDGPTGVGTPDGIAAFRPRDEAEKLAEANLREEERRSAQEREERQRKEREAEEENKQGGGSSSSGSSGNGSTTGAGGASSPNGSSGRSSSAASTVAGQPTIRLTAFALTPSALLALNRVRPKVSNVSFAFTLSAAARVRVALAKLLEDHGRKRWQTLPYALTLAGARGRDRARLSAHGVLTPGSYRLTLTPVHGSAHTLTFQIA